MNEEAITAFFASMPKPADNREGNPIITLYMSMGHTITAELVAYNSTWILVRMTGGHLRAVSTSAVMWAEQ